MYVCMYVCMCVCMYVWTNTVYVCACGVCVFQYKKLHVYAFCTYMCMCLYVCVVLCCVYVCMYVCGYKAGWSMGQRKTIAHKVLPSHPPSAELKPHAVTPHHTHTLFACMCIYVKVPILSVFVPPIPCIHHVCIHIHNTHTHTHAHAHAQSHTTHKFTHMHTNIHTPKCMLPMRTLSGGWYECMMPLSTRRRGQS